MMERTERELRQEIEKEIRVGIDQGMVIDASGLTQKIISAWGTIPEALPGADWWTLCVYGYTRKLVNAAVRAFGEPEDGESEQMEMPGFKDCQIAYLNTREGRQVIVPLVQMTDEEIDAKCEQLSGMEKGLAKHREALQRYKATR